MSSSLSVLYILTLTNILGPGPSLPGLRGIQKQLIDFLSRENSRVKSFFQLDCTAWLQMVLISFFFIPDLSMAVIFIFSTKIVKAVSVASPTFS